MTQGLEGFDAMKTRLDEIVEAVGSDDVSLDEALALYEEAVNIGIAACDASELGVEDEDEGAEVEPEPTEAAGAEPILVEDAGGELVETTAVEVVVSVDEEGDGTSLA